MTIAEILSDSSIIPTMFCKGNKWIMATDCIKCEENILFNEYIMTCIRYNNKFSNACSHVTGINAKHIHLLDKYETVMDEEMKTRPKI